MALLQVIWGKISMVDAEKRLLGHALEDPNNQHFVLLSDRWLGYQISLPLPTCRIALDAESTSFNFFHFSFLFFCSCVPLHNFDYVYNYLMFTNISYIDWWANALWMEPFSLPPLPPFCTDSGQSSKTVD